MFKINKIAAGIALAGSVSALMPMVSYAAESLALEEVTVTARKRTESLQDVPVSVTAITTQLQNSAVRNLKDLQNYVPNVSIDTTPASSAASISIRGISFQEPDKSLDPPVGVILDGVYIGTAAGQILDNFDLERIEVLRGPQGTLFGKNTIAGAINVVRTAPTKELGAKAKFGVGDFGQKEFKAVVNTPLTDRGGLKFYLNKSESDGFINNSNAGGDIGGTDFEQIGVTAAFDVTDNFDISLTVEHIKDDTEMGAWANFNDFTTLPCLISVSALGPYAGVPGEGCMDLDANSDENNSSMNTPNVASVTNDFIGLTMNWTVGDWQLTSITGHVEREESFDLEYDASNVEFLNITGSSDYEQLSQEFRINGNLTEAITLTAGVYYWDSEFRQDQTSHDMWGFLGFPADTHQSLDNTGSNTATSLFASADIQLSDALVLNLGGRYTEEEKTFRAANVGFYSDSIGVLVPDGPMQDFSQKWSEFSPRAALQYTVNDDIMVFTSFAKGFKSGGYFARSTVVDGDGYDPETVETFELGMKSEWMGNRVRMNVTAFMSDYNNKQEEIIIFAGDPPSANTVVRNASAVEMKGLELELTAVVSSELNMYFNAGLLDSNYSEFIADINGDGVDTDNSGLKLRNAPETTIAIGADYVVPTSFGEVAAHYSYRWADEYQTIFSNHPLGKVDSIGTHNASIDLVVGEDYTLSLYGRNLTDERYARVVIIPNFTHFGQYNAPRHFGADFTVNF